MQIIVTIPAEFAALVQARGLEPQSYGQSVIDDAVRCSPLLPQSALARMTMKEFVTAMSANSENIPQLPDVAFTRERFYQDHD